MTQQEFQDLTGRKVTRDEYRSIEKMYYAVPNMEKQEFCKRWVQMENLVNLGSVEAELIAP